MTWIEAPKSSDPIDLAHYVEAELLVSDEEYLSIAELRDGWTSGQAPSEEEFDFVFAEIDRRTRDMGRHYPFFTVDNGVVFDRTGSSALYSFLTLLSLRETPLRLAKDYPRSDPLFDAVVREAVKAALGPSAHALVFGWPPRGDRPAEFPKAVEWLAKRLGVGLRSHEAYSESLDGGVDIVGWAPFPDGRSRFRSSLRRTPSSAHSSRSPVMSSLKTGENGSGSRLIRWLDSRFHSSCGRKTRGGSAQGRT